MEQYPGEEHLSKFQRECELRLRQRLEEFGVELKQREVWLSEPAIRAEFGDLHVWIYVDEAEIGGDGLDCRFEKYDYDTPSQLIEAFVDKVASLLRDRS